MKYLYIGLALLALMLCCSLLSLWQISDGADEIATVLEQAVTACDAQDFSLAYNRAAEAERLWNDHEALFCALLDHAEADEVKWNFSDIRSYMSSDTEHEFRASCAQALAIVRHLKETELPYLYNLL